MKLLKIVLPNMEEKIVKESEVEIDVDGAVYWQSQIESVYDGEEETFYENAWPTDVKVKRTYYVHFNVSKLDEQLDGQDMYVYTLAVLDKNGNIVGATADTETAPYYYDEEKVAGDIDVIRIATDIINKESL